MRYPEFLHKEGTIGFIAPSFGCATEPYRTAFLEAQTEFKWRGFTLRLGPNCYESRGIGKSNTPEKCAEEINEFFGREDVDVILSCGGGETMCEDLDYVDFKQLKKEDPKWFMGYSDNTNLTFLLPTLCDTAAIYGPCAATFGMKPWDASLEETFRLLRGKKLEFDGYDRWEKESLKDEEHPFEPFNLTEPKKLVLWHYDKKQKWVRTRERVKMEGRLLGGCLDILVTLAGTRYDKVERFNRRYEKDGVIWFLEACDLNPLAIRRAMWQLDHAGWFENTKGFIIGRPLCGPEPLMGMDAYQAVLEVVKPYHVPVILDFDIGHLPPQIPMITGAYAKVEAWEDQSYIEFKLK